MGGGHLSIVVGQLSVPLEFGGRQSLRNVIIGPSIWVITPSYPIGCISSDMGYISILVYRLTKTLLLVEVCNRYSRHLKTCHRVRIGFKGSDLRERQCMSAYGVDIGSDKSLLFSHCEINAMPHQRPRASPLMPELPRWHWLSFAALASISVLLSSVGQ